MHRRIGLRIVERSLSKVSLSNWAKVTVYSVLQILLTLNFGVLDDLKGSMKCTSSFCRAVYTCMIIYLSINIKMIYIVNC